MGKSLVIVLYIVSMVTGASSMLQCYVCNGCNDQFNPSEARNITCFGSSGKSKREDSGYVERFCNKVYLKEPKCETLDSASSDDIKACACNTYLCNLASSTELSLILQTVCALAFLISSKGLTFETLCTE